MFSWAVLVNGKGRGSEGQKRFYNGEILCNTQNFYQTPLSFNESQVISPFLNLIISANHEIPINLSVPPVYIRNSIKK